MNIQGHTNILTSPVVVSGEKLTFTEIIQVARFNSQIQIPDSAWQKVNAARKCVEDIAHSEDAYYGINTGFGALSNVRIPKEKLKELQINIIHSHACGVGDPFPCEIVRAVLLLRIQGFLRGHSGVRKETILLMQDFLNHGISPYVPCKGSVGASGDLAPLAHVAFCLIGEGKVFYKNELAPTAEILHKLKLKPLSPEAKEGISLINGTQVMLAIGLLSCYDSLNLLKSADVSAAASLDAFQGTLTAFRAEIQDAKPHAGQSHVAENVRTLLKNDEILEKAPQKVQDPYSFRCIPQVHGAARNAFEHVLSTLMIEANSSTDNPLVFIESGEILSGGNFHGEIIALVLDYLAIAMSEIASIAERRIEKLINANFSSLPPFLTNKGGLCSGFMIPQYTAAALVNENKVLCTPASADSIPTSAEKEDHVSMGMTSANKLRTILTNVSYVLAIETLAAVEGIEFHHPRKPGLGIQSVCQWIRSSYAPVKDHDRSISTDIQTLAQSLKAGELVKHLEPYCILR